MPSSSSPFFAGSAIFATESHSLLWPAVSAAALAFTLLVNATLGRGIASTAAAFPQCITPASAAFSIWSLIYVLTAGLVVQLFRNRTGGVIPNALFLLSCALNTAWVVAFTHGWLFTQAAAITGLLATLLALRRNPQLDAFQKVAVDVYAGWLFPATALGLSMFVKYRLLRFSDDAQHQPYFVAVLLVLAGAVAAAASWLRDFWLPLPAIWGLLWLLQAQAGAEGTLPVRITAPAAAAALVAVVAVIGQRARWAVLN
jgi:hypothetical protein